MRQISSTFESVWLTPRTANYVAALVREGDDFDYGKWLNCRKDLTRQRGSSQRQMR
jgi:hypothetical protein